MPPLLPSWWNWTELNWTWRPCNATKPNQPTNQPCMCTKQWRRSIAEFTCSSAPPGSGCKGKGSRCLLPAALSVVCSCRNVSSLSLSFQCGHHPRLVCAPPHAAAFGHAWCVRGKRGQAKAALNLGAAEQGCDMSRRGEEPEPKERWSMQMHAARSTLSPPLPFLCWGSNFTLLQGEKKEGVGCFIGRLLLFPRPELLGFWNPEPPESNWWWSWSCLVMYPHWCGSS